MFYLIINRTYALHVRLSWFLAIFKHAFGDVGLTCETFATDLIIRLANEVPYDWKLIRSRRR